MKKIFTKDVAKTVGNASLRIGKDIVREGVKAVIMKSAVTVGTTIVFDKPKNVKNITLDDILGDISRKEKKVARKLARQAKREAKLNTDIEDLEKEKKIFNDLQKELEEAMKVANDLHGSNDEIVK